MSHLLLLAGLLLLTGLLERDLPNRPPLPPLLISTWQQKSNIGCNNRITKRTNLHSVAAHPGSVQLPDSVLSKRWQSRLCLFHLSISPIFHLHEGKTRRLPGNPDIANPTNAIESVFDVKPLNVFVGGFFFSSEYHRLTLFCIFQFQNPCARCLIISLNIPILHNMQPNQGIRDCLLLSKTQISFLSTVAKICSLSQTGCAQTPLAAPLNKKQQNLRVGCVG